MKVLRFQPIAMLCIGLVLAWPVCADEPNFVDLLDREAAQVDDRSAPPIPSSIQIGNAQSTAGGTVEITLPTGTITPTMNDTGPGGTVRHPGVARAVTGDGTVTTGAGLLGPLSTGEAFISVDELAAGDGPYRWLPSMCRPRHDSIATIGAFTGSSSMNELGTSDGDSDLSAFDNQRPTADGLITAIDGTDHALFGFGN